jgi:hypothetical protein
VLVPRTSSEGLAKLCASTLNARGALRSNHIDERSYRLNTLIDQDSRLEVSSDDMATWWKSRGPKLNVIKDEDFQDMATLINTNNSTAGNWGETPHPNVLSN